MSTLPGRDAQAEEILKEALRSQPSCNTIRVKLQDQVIAKAASITAPTQPMGGLDFNSLTAPTPPQAVEAQETAQTAPLQLLEPLTDNGTFNLSGMNLDLYNALQTHAPETVATGVHAVAGDVATAIANPEMATKLDLAVAYKTIGDKQGARELLEEVLKGGSGEQVQAAQALLAKL